MPPSLSASSFQTVLLVEDEPQLALMAESTLQDYGIADIHLASDATSAMALLQHTVVDLVICDLGLPGADGVSLLKEIGQLPQAPAIIILSSVENSLLRAAEQLVRGMGLNLLGAVPKPLRTETLHALLRSQPPAMATAPASIEVNVPDALLLEGLRQAWYQPYFEARIGRVSGRVEGVELLARLCPPGQPVITPQAFIHRLEALGSIDLMTWQIAAPGFAFVADCARQGLPLNLSLNLSAHSLNDDALVDKLAALAAAHGLVPTQITLEITESTAIASSRDTLERLVHLRLKGFGLSIDDFGTGFSSLAQLSRVPFTEMKIDRQFTSAALSDPKAHAVVESSIALARRLGINTCAEGVESAELLRLLHDLGADSFQGYHFHHPMSGAVFLDWARDYRVTV